MKKYVRLDEPDASSAGMNKAALMEGPRAVQVVDLDLQPGAGQSGYLRSSPSYPGALPVTGEKSRAGSMNRTAEQPE